MKLWKSIECARLLMKLAPGITQFTFHSSFNWSKGRSQRIFVRVLLAKNQLYFSKKHCTKTYSTPNTLGVVIQVAIFFLSNRLPVVKKWRNITKWREAIRLIQHNGSHPFTTICHVYYFQTLYKTYLFFRFSSFWVFSRKIFFLVFLDFLHHFLLVFIPNCFQRYT